ncbi:hypothetical protein ABH309_03460 [Chromobacterium piscinae]|uniref:Uncharacterized protein n=1 Tax=Chromobacterium piscinae TaxID=686831 RepID=A0ABV0H163_9NEIS
MFTFLFKLPGPSISVGRQQADIEPHSAESRRVARSAYGYVLKVQTTMRTILPSARTHDLLQARAGELLRKDHYTWGELFELEMLCVELASDDMLALICPTDVDPKLSLMDAERTFEGRIAGVSPMPAAPGRPVAVDRGELRRAVLLGQQRYFRALRRESALDRLRFRLGLFTLVLALSGGVYYWLSTGHPTDCALALSAIFGILGAFASVLQRIQSVGEKAGAAVQSGASVAMLMEGSWSLYLALASGAVFGILGFWLLAGGLGGTFLSARLVPQFGASGATCDSLALPYLLAGADYGKMAVWAFFFGFAERFIPDLLTQLAKNGATSVSRESYGGKPARAGARKRPDAPGDGR